MHSTSPNSSPERQRLININGAPNSYYSASSSSVSSAEKSEQEEKSLPVPLSKSRELKKSGDHHKSGGLGKFKSSDGQDEDNITSSDDSTFVTEQDIANANQVQRLIELYKKSKLLNNNSVDNSNNSTQSQAGGKQRALANIGMTSTSSTGTPTGKSTIGLQANALYISSIITAGDDVVASVGDHNIKDTVSYQGLGKEKSAPTQQLNNTETSTSSSTTTTQTVSVASEKNSSTISTAHNNVIPSKPWTGYNDDTEGTVSYQELDEQESGSAKEPSSTEVQRRQEQLEGFLDKKNVLDQLPQEPPKTIIRSVRQDDDNNTVIEFDDGMDCCPPCLIDTSNCMPTAECLQNACSYILNNNNEADDWYLKSFISFINIRMRCFLAVDTWTTIRQMVARALGLLALKYPILGWALGATPIVWVITGYCAGYVYDKWNAKVSDDLLDEFIDSIRHSIDQALRSHNRDRDEQGFGPSDRAEDEVNNFVDRLMEKVKQAYYNDDCRVDAIKKTLFPDPVSKDCVIDINNSDTQPPESQHELGPEEKRLLENELEDDLEIKLDSKENNLLPITTLDDLINKIKKEAGLDDKTCLQIKQQIEAAFKDLEKGVEHRTWTTKCTTLVRVISTIIIAALGSVAAYSFILGKIGPTLFSYAFTYCMPRDFTQTLFPLVDKLKKFDMVGAGKSGLRYALNQFVATFLSSWLAGPSGQAGIGLKFLDAFYNDLIRGHINGWFEAIDTWCIYYDQCKAQGLDIEVGLTMKTEDFWARLVNTQSGIGFMRQGAFTEVVLAESDFFDFVEIDKNAHDLAKKAAVAAFDGGYLGILTYLRLIASMRVNWPHEGFLQSIGNMLR